MDQFDEIRRSEKRELASRVRLLLCALLQCSRRVTPLAGEMRLAIAIQRQDLTDMLIANPRLQGQLADCFETYYSAARRLASSGCNLPRSEFPETCPVTLEETLNPEFWPG